jgi:hypothetical protein
MTPQQQQQLVVVLVLARACCLPALGWLVVLVQAARPS